MVVMNVIRVVRYGPLSYYHHYSECLRVMRVRHDMHVMSPIPFVLKMCLRHISLQMYLRHVMWFNPFPSIIILSVMRDMRVMHVIHVMSPTLLLQ